MRRRAFITLFSVARRLPWPLAARAQRPDRVRHIGVLMTAAVADPEAQARLAAFQEEMRQLGWVVGRNVRNRHPLGRK